MKGLRHNSTSASFLCTAGRGFVVELEPQDLVSERLFCCVLDCWYGEVASDGETVGHVGEEVELVVDLVLLENLLRLGSQLSREKGVLFCAGEYQRLGDGVELLIADKRWVCEGPDVQQALGSEEWGQELGAKAVADTGQVGCVWELGLEGVEKLLRDGVGDFRTVVWCPRLKRHRPVGLEWVTVEDVHDDDRVAQTSGESVGHELGVDQLEPKDVCEHKEELFGALGVVFRDVTVQVADLLDLALRGAVLEDDLGAACLRRKRSHCLGGLEKAIWLVLVVCLLNCNTR